MSLLQISDLHKHYVMKKQSTNVVETLAALLKREKQKVSMLHALDGVSLDIADNESVGLVGESGCGKSTLVKSICRLTDTTEGRIVLNGVEISAITPNKFVHAPERGDIQVVFQDSHESMNPRYSAFQCIADPLRNILKINDTSALESRINELANQVGFPKELLTRLPHQLSGGQKARINIARAIAVSPKLLILDEPTSALDVSVQALILKLLVKLRQELKISYLFVSHDLNVVRMLCDRIIVMYMGKIVETGDTASVFHHAAHPYTRALLSSIPSNTGAERIILRGEISSPIDPDPNACRFYSRCELAQDKCLQVQPTLRTVSSDHRVACHFT